jgi:hypothetical protein
VKGRMLVGLASAKSLQPFGKRGTIMTVAGKFGEGSRTQIWQDP